MFGILRDITTQNGESNEQDNHITPNYAEEGENGKESQNCIIIGYIGVYRVI